MDTLQSYCQALAGRGFRPTSHAQRTIIVATEHETKLLPSDVVQQDGSLDLYEDVQTLFRPVFDKGQPAVQCGGWVGYIPLNDKYALEVSPRVPIDNLERLIGLAAGYSPELLKKYTRYFAHTSVRPVTLFDILASQFLAAFDRICITGFVKEYDLRQKISDSPSGRIDPFRSALETQQRGRPTALSSSYDRTIDFGPNRLIRYALEKLLRRYLEFQDAGSHKARIRHIRRALDRLEHVKMPSHAEISPPAIAQYIARLPAYHEHYADALMIAQVVIANIGIAIRGSGGIAVLPTILVDMSKVFEEYARRLLADSLTRSHGMEVKDGNKAGAGGAKQNLFEPIRSNLRNSPITPDIVVMIAGSARLIIDTKYKPPSVIPDRNDINQVVTYGARYACEKVMILYPRRLQDSKPVEMIGKIGAYTVYTGHLDLGEPQIQVEEQAFVAALVTLLGAAQ